MTILPVRIKAFLFFSFLFLVSSGAFSQPLHQGEWKTYTAMNGVTDLAVVPSSGNVWTVTSGGAFRFLLAQAKPKDSLFALRNSDGLSNNDLTAVAADDSNNIYFGGSGGTFDIYNESSGKITAIRDIALTPLYTQKNIYAISISGNRVYLSTGFGISIYDRTQHIFSETISQFGSLKNQDTVFAAAEINDSIYTVHSGAIAIAAKNAPNLSAPFAWRIINGPSLAFLRTVVSFNGKIIIGALNGLYSIGDSLQYISTGDSISVVRLAVSGNTLFIVDSRNNNVISTTDLINFTKTSFIKDDGEQNITAFAIGKEGEKIFGYAQGGVAVGFSSGQTVTSLFPDGPLVNYITDLHFAESLGKLFVTLDQSGLSQFDPLTSSWTGFGTQQGVLPRTSYRSSFYDTVHSVLWLSAIGGMYSLASANPASIKHLGFSQGLPTSSIGGDTGFIIMGKGSLDNHGNFMASVWAVNGKGLVTTADGNIFNATELNTPDNLFRPFGVVAQDMDDYYYVGTVDNQDPFPYGVMVVATDGTTIPIPGGNGGKLGSSSVNALLVDQDNGVWCGSNVGVEVLTHSRDFRTGLLVFNTRKLTFLDQQFVKAIAVDGVGNKWVGTDNGVFVVSADGSDSLAHFTTSNSPLIDNSITTIAIDSKKGEAYIGTPKGISRVSSIYQEGSTDYSKILLYPNPVIQHSDDAIKITITGLVSGSTIKIYSAGGRLVSTIDGSQLGSTVVWNGRDENGKVLQSGVYVAAAASPIATTYGQTKFVLIRK